MPRARDLLERFSPIGTPGAAAPASVPVDRAAEGMRELQPVFDGLAEVQAECAHIRDTARAEAARLRDEATNAAVEIVAIARREASTARADASARARQAGAGQLAALGEQAEREAAAIRERSNQRMDGYVERIVAAVRHSCDSLEQSLP